MYYCFWKNCDESLKKLKYFEDLSNCLKYADKIKYVTCGDNGHIDTNDKGAHYFEIGKIENKIIIEVYLRIYHHWDDSCSYDKESSNEENSDEES